MRIRPPVLIAQLVLAGSLAIGAFESVRAYGVAASRVPWASHLDAWTRTTEARVETALGPAYPIATAVRAVVPAQAVVLPWVDWATIAHLPADTIGRLTTGFSAVLAPRFVVAIVSPDDLVARRHDLLETGLPVFLLQFHPGPSPGNLPRMAFPPALGEVTLVADRPDFTLHEVQSRR